MSLLEDIKRLKAIKKEFTVKQESKESKTPANQNKQISKTSCNVQEKLETSLKTLDQKQVEKPVKKYRPEFLSDQQEIQRLASLKQAMNPQQSKTKSIQSIVPKKQPEKPPINLFNNIKFCFPVYNAELTKQRIQNITNNCIIPYGGEVLDFLQLQQMADCLGEAQEKENMEIEDKEKIDTSEKEKIEIQEKKKIETQEKEKRSEIQDKQKMGGVQDKEKMNRVQVREKIDEIEQKEKIDENQQKYKSQYPFVNYFLIDKNIPRQNIENQADDRIGFEQILDVNYVFDCLKVGKVLETDFYIIKRKDQEFYNEHIEKMKKNLRGQQKSLSNQFTSFFTNPNSAAKGLNPDPLIKKGSFNQFIAQSFERLKEMYQKTDRGRAFAYGRASSIVKSLNRQITCEDDVDKLVGHRFLGKKTLAKIKEMITTGSLQRLNMMSGKEVNMACGKLAKVWGIGKESALEFYNRGIKSIEQLQEAFDKGQVTLTKNQKIGLKYNKDLQVRIPRDKVTRMFDFVKKQFVSLVGSDKEHNIEVAGSYRRNKENCGDIDILITRKDGRWEKNIVNDLVERLKQLEFITDILTMPRHLDPKSCVSFMGICQFEDETHHRIDIKYYPVEQYAYALLYFTGSGQFNRLMRLHALRKGYKLSDHGMSKAERISMTKTAVYGPEIICMSEQEIFAFLQFEYKNPQERSL